MNDDCSGMRPARLSLRFRPGPACPPHASRESTVHRTDPRFRLDVAVAAYSPTCWLSRDPRPPFLWAYPRILAKRNW